MMNTLKIENLFRDQQRPVKAKRTKNYLPVLLLGLLLLIWPLVQHLVMRFDPTIGFIDPNIWLLLLLGLIAFMMTVGVCWWFMRQFWMSMGLPVLGNMVLQYKELTVWQQLGFYWASFALLLLAAVGVLSAIV